MKILFITSRKTKDFLMPPFVKSQSDSIKSEGHLVDYFFVETNGIRCAWGSVKRLKSIRKNYDIFHAHYSTNGLFAVLAGCKSKLIISFLGSDLLGIRKDNCKKARISYLIERISKIVASRARFIIVKTNQMKQIIPLKYHHKTLVVPNGVNFNLYKPMQQEIARLELGLSKEKKYILFLGNPNDLNKNFSMAKNAVDLLKTSAVEIIAPYPVPPEKVPIYLSAANVLLLTSFSEGSSNVVKEALACNLPVISTNVGDVKENINEVKNCFIVNHDPVEIAEKINLILINNDRSNGRELSIHLEINNIAKKIITIYNKIYDSRN